MPFPFAAQVGNPTAVWGKDRHTFGAKGGFQAAQGSGVCFARRHGQEKEVFGDQAYWSEFHRLCAKASGIRYRMNRRGNKAKPLTAYQKRTNRIRSSTRARGEHAFHVVKRLWGFSKVRYRGLAKTTARLFTTFALANLYMLRRRLLTPQGTCAW